MRIFRIALVTFSLALTVAMNCKFAVAQGDLAPTGVDDIVAQIVKARELTSGYVSIAKDTFQKPSAEYVQSEKLYIAAYSDYAAWNAYVKSALLAGHAKHLNSDENYQRIANKAAASATTFVQYVDEKTKPQTKAVVTVLSSLADLGIKLWTNISDKIKKDRETAATNFDNATKWKPWAELVESQSPTTTTFKPTSTEGPKAHQ